jgi:hypothetical protein
LYVNLKGKLHKEDLNVNGSIFLKLISHRMEACRLDSPGSGQEPVVGSCANKN